MQLFEIEIEGVKVALDSKNAHHLNMLYRDGLRKVINAHKIALGVKNGRDFTNGNYSLSAMISKSNQYYELMKNDKTNFRNNLKQDGVNLIMKDDVRLTPIEQLAIAPARILEQMDFQHKLFGYDVSPFALTERVHKNAHLETMAHMNAILPNILRTARMGDSKLFEDTSFYNMEKNNGILYAVNMGNKFYDLLSNIKTLDTQTIDRNEDFIAFKEEFNSKFAELSNVAKVIATYKFLNGITRRSNTIDKFHKTNFPRVIPPVSGTKGEYTLLSPKIMSKYFESYNNNVTLNRSTDSIKNLPGGDAITQAIKDICG